MKQIKNRVRIMMRLKNILLIILLTFPALLFAQTQIESSGTSTDYTLSFPGEFTYTPGIAVTFKVHVTSQNPPITMNVNGQGAIIIKKLAFDDLAPQELRMGQIVTLVYDGTNFQLMTPGGNTGNISGSGTANYVAKWSASNTLSNSSMYDDGTNVGIGTTSPNNLLQVSGLLNCDNLISSTSLGYHAGLANTANGGTFLGYNTGNANTSGDANTFIGGYCANANTTGRMNTFIGNSTGISNTIGQYNTYLGAYTAYNMLGGSYNTFLGNSAGSTTTDGDYNTFVGFNAGGSTSNVGSDNTYLGHNATGITGLSYASAIGAGSSVGSSNSLILGHSTVKVGIGTTVPAYQLHMKSSSQNAIMVDNTTNSSQFAMIAGSYCPGYEFAPHFGFISDTYGNVGDGSGTVRFFIQGTTGNIGVNAGTSGINPLYRFDIRGTSSKATTSAYENILNVGSTDNAAPLSLRFGIKTDATSANRYAGIEVDDNGTKQSLALQPLGGKVGIGTSSPSELLEVNGNVKLNGALMPAGNAGTSGQVLQSTGAATAPTWINLPVFANTALTSNQTTSTTAATAIPALSFTLNPGETWSFEFNLQNGCAGAGGLKYAITYPSGCTMRATAVGMSTAATAVTSDVMTTNGTLGIAFNAINNANGWTRIAGSITAGASGGAVTLNFASTTNGQVSTIYNNSYMVARKH